MVSVALVNTMLFTATSCRNVTTVPTAVSSNMTVSPLKNSPSDELYQFDEVLISQKVGFVPSAPFQVLLTRPRLRMIWPAASENPTPGRVPVSIVGSSVNSVAAVPS